MPDGVLSWLSRFVNEKNLVRIPGRIFPETFLQEDAPHSTSVYMHQSPYSDIRWNAGCEMNQQQSLKGSCEIHSDEVRFIGLEPKKTHSEIDTDYHVELCGWPQDGEEPDALSQRFSIASDLSNAAVYVPYPASKKNLSGRLPKVSFVCITGVDDQSAALTKTLESLASLNHLAWELVLINNGNAHWSSVVEADFEERDSKELLCKTKVRLKASRFRAFSQGIQERSSCVARAQRLCRAQMVMLVEVGETVDDALFNKLAEKVTGQLSVLPQVFSSKDF